jgi:hypothetical protein
MGRVGSKESLNVKLSFPLKWNSIFLNPLWFIGIFLDEDFIHKLDFLRNLPGILEILYKSEEFFVFFSFP